MTVCNLLPHLQKAKFVKIAPHEGDNTRACNKLVARRLVVHEVEVTLPVARLLTAYAKVRMRHHVKTGRQHLHIGDLLGVSNKVYISLIKQPLTMSDNSPVLLRVGCPVTPTISPRRERSCTSCSINEPSTSRP